MPNCPIPWAPQNLNLDLVIFCFCKQKRAKARQRQRSSQKVNPRTRDFEVPSGAGCSLWLLASVPKTKPLGLPRPWRVRLGDGGRGEAGCGGSRVRGQRRKDPRSRGRLVLAADAAAQPELRVTRARGGVFGVARARHRRRERWEAGGRGPRATGGGAHRRLVYVASGVCSGSSSARRAGQAPPEACTGAGGPGGSP